MYRRRVLRIIVLIGFGIIFSLVFLEVVLTQQSKEYKTMWANISQSVEKLRVKFKLQPDALAVIVDPSKQELYLIRGQTILKTYPISTGKAGLGCQAGSYKTPIGTHKIQEKYGDGAKMGTIFKARKNTDQLAKIYTNRIKIKKDYITTRIMWLEGQENHLNKGANVDSHARYIYIHGTAEEGLIGQPASQGCIRMRNKQVIELFDYVPSGTLIEIQNKEFVKAKTKH